MNDNRCTERKTQRNQAGNPIKYNSHIRKIVTHFTPAKKKRKRKTQDGLKYTKFLA